MHRFGVMRGVTGGARAGGLWSCLGNVCRTVRSYRSGQAGRSFSSGFARSVRDPEVGDEDHVFVAMSSGVDSSTVAAMMAEQYPGRVSGVYMANWSSTAKCTEADWNDVQRICKFVGIGCERVNLERDYWTEVFEPMIRMYRQGLTPNPDVGCNRHVKFGALFDYLQGKNLSKRWWLATGHYARLGRDEDNGEHWLMRPVRNPAKDQSYYLSSIDPKTLERVLFPLAPYTKPEVRGLAQRYGLHTASKPDSQGLCFVSQNHNNFRNFLAEYLEPSPGDIVTEDGKVVGKHNGIWHATIGQRSSVSMPQADPNYRGVWYVSDKDPVTNRITIVRGVDNPSLYSQSATCDQFDWLCSDPSTVISEGGLTAQYRSLQDPVPVEHIDTTNGVKVKFATKCRAIAPGQYLVLYHGDRVIGSGMISVNSHHD
uniref:tRNA-5-taurinomethyluridine 2-sulfurtransferase n=1 Tax=Blastobotrys adeninivorans TaxID=409370 RepID=A0A060T1T4_BLAAD